MLVTVMVKLNVVKVSLYIKCGQPVAQVPQLAEAVSVCRIWQTREMADITVADSADGAERRKQSSRLSREHGKGYRKEKQEIE